MLRSSIIKWSSSHVNKNWRNSSERIFQTIWKLTPNLWWQSSEPEPVNRSTSIFMFLPTTLSLSFSWLHMCRHAPPEWFPRPSHSIHIRRSIALRSGNEFDRLRKRRHVRFSLRQVQLSKTPTKKPQDLLLRDQAYMKKAKIDLMLETEVTSVNWEGKSLTYHTLGKQMKSEQYDYLVLATGLRSRKLPASIRGGDLRNIFYLRSMEDANNLVSQYLQDWERPRWALVRSVLIADKVKSPETKNIAIIGDSFIALELCGWLTTGLAGPDGKQEEKDKKNVSVIMLLKAPMIRKWDEDHRRSFIRSFVSRYFRGEGGSCSAESAREKWSEILCGSQCHRNQREYTSCGLKLVPSINLGWE